RYHFALHSLPTRRSSDLHLGLDFYSQEEMQQILLRSSGILGIKLSREEIAAIAARSRGTPRIGNRLLARVRDFVEVMRTSAASRSEEHTSGLQSRENLVC